MIFKLKILLERSWKQRLISQFTLPYMQQLREFLLHEKQQRKVIYPNGQDIFQAFALTPFEQVRVVILGQDPYHGAGQAHGLCFSVLPGQAIPPSLQNIYKELSADIGVQPVKHGYLGSWANQGILLLNSVLTVEQAKAGAHQNKGWEKFTDAVIKSLVEQAVRPIIFVLWGNYAQKKADCVAGSQHVILKSMHPSPLSAHRGFFGCKHFSKINAQLQKWGEKPIDWQLPSKPRLITKMDKNLCDIL